MAVIWLVLRDQDQIRFKAELLEMGNAWLCFLLRVGEDGIEDD